MLKAMMRKLRGLFNAALFNLSSFYKDLPIRIKLMVVLNIVMLVPFVAISSVCYRNSEDMLKSKSIQYSQDILKIIDLRVGDYISNLDSLSGDLVDDPTISAYIRNDRHKTDPVEIYHDEEYVKEILKDDINLKGDVQSISIFVDGKLNCYADDTSERESIEDIMPMGGPLYKKLLNLAYKGDGAPVWYLDGTGGKVKDIFYARAVVDPNNYKNCGMLVLLVKTDWFDTVFNGLVNEDMKKTAVISQDKQVVLSKSGAENYPLSDEIFRGMNYDQGWIVDDAQNTLISYVTVKGTDWKIASYIPLSVLYSDVEFLKQKIIISLFCAVAFLLIISFYISFDFVSSINKLVDGMKRLQKGDVGAEVALRRKDELGFMGSTFNTMVKEITTLQKWVLREQLTRKDAQIKALQSQINPHFLFNTLESINWMAQLNDVPEISETVTALASLMEASIARGDRCITLAEEIQYIDNYILILKKRFGPRLELVKSVDEGVLPVKVPRLLIQPLIENAANHGVANIRGKGIVRLTAERDGDNVLIIVEDNGAGIDEDELEILNGRLSMGDEEYFRRQENRAERGIGLENVNRRIKLFYGPQYGIKIESREGSYTKIIVNIPFEANDKTLGTDPEGED